MNRFLKGFGIVLALAGVGVISAFAVVALLLRQEEVRVPDLTGQDIVTAIETVTQQGLQLKVERREPHPTMPRDTVISQTPSPGIGIKKGRPVRIIVSQGPSETQTPNLVGEHMRKAEMTVRQAGFFPGALSRAWSEDVQRDVVIAQDPAAGSPLARGGKISMLVSSGKKTTMLVMPKLIGKRAEEAVRTVERTGLQHRVVYKTSTNAAVGAERVVIGKKPGPGYPIPSDGTVEIVVSK
jgi:beta-lactam-binding protein with PASTA domain